MCKTILGIGEVQASLLWFRPVQWCLGRLQAQVGAYQLRQRVFTLGSTMTYPFLAAFPLNITLRIVRCVDGLS